MFFVFRSQEAWGLEVFENFAMRSNYALEIMLALQTALAQKASVTQPVDPQTIQLDPRQRSIQGPRATGDSQ